MPIQRLLHRRSAPEKPQISFVHLRKKRHSTIWRLALFFLATIMGGVIGYISLPSHITDIIVPGYTLSTQGVRLFAVLGGSGACLLLVIWLDAVVKHEYLRQSRRALFFCCAGIVGVALIGALLCGVFLPGILFVSIRLFFGAIIGLVGLAVLVGIIQNPGAALAEALGAGLEGFVLCSLGGSWRFWGWSVACLSGIRCFWEYWQEEERRWRPRFFSGVWRWSCEKSVQNTLPEKYEKGG